MAAVPLSEVSVQLRPEDNVAVTAKSLPPGTELRIGSTTVAVPARIGMGHKLAVRPIAKGQAVTKYGQIIGFATRDIAAGEHVHVHNVAADNFERDYAFCRDCPPPMPTPAEKRTFLGYDRGPDRPDHLRYGTRNYIAIISTVNCSASPS